jgi:hypothetical protein
VQYQTVVLFLFCFGKRKKDTQLAMKKASGAFTSSKTRSCHLFSISCAEEERMAHKTVGKLYKCPDGNNAVCPTKCGNYEQSANGSQRAYKSGVPTCTGTWKEKEMKKFSLALLAIATALAITPAALAQGTYSFSFTCLNGGGYDYPCSSSGYLDVNASGIVTNIVNGIYNGEAMILDSPGSYGNNDNMFYPSGNPSYVDYSGITFDASGVSYNLAYYNGTGIVDIVNNPGGYPSGITPVSFSASYVPDGGTTLTLLGLAIAGLAGLRRKLGV